MLSRGGRAAAASYAAVYLAFTACWIFFSDRLVDSRAATRQELNWFQTFKGWVFVALTTWLVYLLLRMVQTQALRRRATEHAARQALHASEALFRSVFNQQSRYMAILSPDGTIRELNEPTLRVNQLNRDDCVGKLLWASPLWNEVDGWREAWPSRLQAAAAQEAPLTVEDVLKFPGGDVRYVRVTTTAVRDASGGLAYFLVDVIDDSDRRRAEQALAGSEERLRSALAAAHMGIWEWRIAEDSIYWSPESFAMMRVRPAAQTMADVERRVHPEDLPRLRAAMRNAIETRSALAVEYRGIRGDGSMRWFASDARAEYGESGRAVRLIGTIIDITDRIEAIEARRLAVLHREFIANVSHEIRTPLNAVLGLARIGLRDSHGRRHRDTFAGIVESGEMLLSIVDDVLDFSKLEAGKLEIDATPFAIGEAVDRALSVTAHAIYAKGLRLAVVESAQVPPSCVGDSRRLSQALANLLSNAGKFTERGGVTLHVDVDGAWLVFKVIDTGVGIAPDKMARLFRPFEQVDGAPSRRFGGTGLGLVITRRLMQAMGGDVRVESVSGRGSCFALRLPLVGPQELPAPPARQARMTLAGFDADDAARIAGACGERGITTSVCPPEFAPETAADLVVFDGRCLDNETAVVAARQVAGRGTRIAVAALPGHGDRLALRVGGRVEVVGLPLRARHLMDLLDGDPAPVGLVPGAAGEHRLANRHVLVVEDNRLNQTVISDMLAAEGARVTVAADGLEALAAFRDAGAPRFDVVLMDVQMPGIDGYETTRRLAAIAPDVPVVGLTAHVGRDERLRCLDAGMSDYLSKPVDADRLASALRRVLDGMPAREGAAHTGEPPSAATPPSAPRPELLQTARATFAENALELSRALAADDRVALAGVAHAIRGASSLIGAHHVADRAASLEDALAGAGDPAPAASALLGALEALRDALDAPV